MTRKHFEMIAEALKEAKASYTVVTNLADKLEETNPRFNRSVFIQACKQ